MIYAVIDTNVFVSALFSKNINAATVKVLDAIFQGKIVPLYNDEIIAEYEEVLQFSYLQFAVYQLVLIKTVEKWCRRFCR